MSLRPPKPNSSALPWVGSSLGKYINKDLNFGFKGNGEGVSKYKLVSVKPLANKKLVEFHFFNENGIDSDSPYANNKKNVFFTYNISEDIFVNKGYNNVTLFMNPLAVNFLTTAARLIRQTYYKANPPKIEVDGKFVVDPNFNINSKVKKQDFRFF